jgi:hypothetical protein
MSATNKIHGFGCIYTGERLQGKKKYIELVRTGFRSFEYKDDKSVDIYGSIIITRYAVTTIDIYGSIIITHAAPSARSTLFKNYVSDETRSNIQKLFGDVLSVDSWIIESSWTSTNQPADSTPRTRHPTQEPPGAIFSITQNLFR